VQPKEFFNQKTKRNQPDMPILSTEIDAEFEKELLSFQSKLES